MSVRARAALGVAGAVIGAVLLWQIGVLEVAVAAAVELQRSLQDGLAGAARALARGEPEAVWSLIGLSTIYGLAHAAGPGHGKALLGAAAVAGAERPIALATLSAAAALAQALTAIVIVYGGLALLSLSPMVAMTADQSFFAPIGYAAAGIFGLIFAWRGLRGLRSGHAHCCGGHTPERRSASRWRDRAGIVAAVGARPCAGAMIVLAVAWMAGAPWVGIAAAIAMAVGVAVVTAAVALGGLAFRDAALVAGGTARATRLAAVLQVTAGVALCVFAAAGLPVSR
jgi:ABC-type nickel/cobalt efflux system permease component RcnA